MIRMAEPLAWKVDLESGYVGRQLRLVPDDVAPVGDDVTAGVAGTTAPSAGTATATLETPAAAGEAPADPEVAPTLAAYVVGLRSGSQCCWCGSTLVEGQDDGRLRLECRSCDAVVEGPKSVHGGGVRL